MRGSDNRLTIATKLHRYEGRGGTVTYDAKRCIHAAECVRGLPAVFDANAKPWINPDGADALRWQRSSTAARAGRCTCRATDVAVAERAAPARRTPRRSRPTARRICAASSRSWRRTTSVTLRDTRMALCRCGASQNKPFATAATARAASGTTARCRRHQPSRAGRRRPAGDPGERNGPLILTGPLTLIGTNGRTSHAETTFLCRCGASATSPTATAPTGRSGSPPRSCVRGHARAACPLSNRAPVSDATLRRLRAGVCTRPSVSHRARCRSFPTSRSTATRSRRASAGETLERVRIHESVRAAHRRAADRRGRRQARRRRAPARQADRARARGRTLSRPAPDDRRPTALARARREAAGADHARASSSSRPARSRSPRPARSAARRSIFVRGEAALATFDAGGLEIFDDRRSRRSPRA